jgi:23S rRNA (cytosine1962-C5)-methyltransferase
MARANVGEVGARWIPEDTVTFLERAARRGEAYDAVVMDAPTFGRGPRGKMWQLRRDLPRAVELIGRVLALPPAGVWVSAHAEGGTAGELAETLRAGLGVEAEDVSALQLGMRSEDGRRLEAGFAACTPGVEALSPGFDGVS